MALFIKQHKDYPTPVDATSRAAREAIAALGGKPLSAAGDVIEAKFEKTVLGKVLGDRTQAKLSVMSHAGGSRVEIEVFPLNAIGQRLMFGERRGVSETIVAWLFAHLEHRLPKP
jgi:hypothetical protein